LAEKAKINLEKAFSEKDSLEKYEKIAHRITRLKRKKNKYEK